MTNTKIENYSELTGKQKVAILIVSLGVERSSNVIRYLDPAEVETISYEISMLHNISKEVREKVIKEFEQLIMGAESLFEGGMEYAKEILEKGFGIAKANDIINKLGVSIQVKPFRFLKNVATPVLVNVLQLEHPQTVALVLSHIDVKKSSDILSQLPNHMRTDIAKRIATMERINPEILKEVDDVLQKKLSDFNEDYTQSGGIEVAANILNLTDRATEKSILENLESIDPEIAEEVKKNMFVFDDLVILDDRAIQIFLREVDNDTLARALKSSSEEVKEKIFSNVSSRAREILQEDINFMGPVRLSDVNEAQQKILAIIKRLENEGEIIRARYSDQEVVG